ncbi:RNA polymerase sigma factor [Micromonospora vulcania]|uniref:RNA polymerase sigma factor n=1 Tax=Micromonospora vulcania TaxID=1441873 RepID=A0ABW1HEQ9_9ACTN
MNSDLSPHEAFELFFLKNRHKLVNAVAAWTGDRHLAEDIAQEVMATLAAYRYDRPEILMYQMARQRLSRPAFIPSQYHPLDSKIDEIDRRTCVSGADSVVDSLDLDAELLRALRRLPARQREVIVLEVICDLSQEQVAEILGIRGSTVKTHKARGLRKLEELMARRLSATGPGAEQPVGGV